MKTAFYLLPLHLAYCHGYGINRIISFGDDMSDTGNYFKLTNYTKPSRSIYYKGRFSNSLVWPEVLASSLNAMLVDYAYAYASPDNTMFKDDRSDGVPGCIQQVENFFNDHPYEEFGGKDHMALFAFTRLTSGNKANGTLAAQTIRRCLTNLLSAKKMSRVAILTHFPYDMFPIAQAMSVFKSKQYKKYYGTWNAEMEDTLIELTTQFPNTKFHPVNLRNLLEELANGTSIFKPNVKMLKDEPFLEGHYNRDGSYSPYNSNLSLRLFWDPSHVTAQVHGYIARTVLKAMDATPYYG